MHPADVPEERRMAETYGDGALALISHPFVNPAPREHAPFYIDNVDTLIYWRARLAARHAARYLAEERTK